MVSFCKMHAHKIAGKSAQHWVLNTYRKREREREWGEEGCKKRGKSEGVAFSRGANRRCKLFKLPHGR